MIKAAVSADALPAVFCKEIWKVHGAPKVPKVRVRYHLFTRERTVFGVRDNANSSESSLPATGSAIHSPGTPGPRCPRPQSELSAQLTTDDGTAVR